MAGSQEILQEYLVSLGYKTDTVSLKKFEDGLGLTGKRIMKVGGVVAAVAVAVEAAAAAFAYSMRKVYFQSQLANTSVVNLKAMAFAGQQVGISADAMAGALASAGAMMRNFPQRVAFEGLTGISTQGKEASQVLQEFLVHMKKLEAQSPIWHTLGASWASQYFGMAEGDYTLALSGLDSMIEKQKKIAKMYADMGYDPKKQEASIKKYTETLDEIALKFEILGALILSSPIFSKASWGLNQLLDGWTSWFTKDFFSPGEGTNGDLVLKMLGIKKPSSAKPTTTKPSAPLGEFAPDATTKQIDWSKTPLGRPRRQASGQATSGDRQAFLTSLEEKNGLPSGLLDKVWKRESQRGNPLFMKSSAGAEGHFQFVPPTAKQYGVSDPYNFEQSASGAASMYKHLLKKYKGNLSHALAAYNWGEGNLDKHLKGTGAKRMPSETQDYISAITSQASLGTGGSSSGVNIVQTTTISVHGSDAKSTAEMVAQKQQDVNASIQRNMQASMR